MWPEDGARREQRLSLIQASFWLLTGSTPMLCSHMYYRGMMDTNFTQKEFGMPTCALHFTALNLELTCRFKPDPRSGISVIAWVLRRCAGRIAESGNLCRWTGPQTSGHVEALAWGYPMGCCKITRHCSLPALLNPFWIPNSWDQPVMVWPEMGHEFPSVVKPELGICPSVEEDPPLNPLFLGAIGFRVGTHGQHISSSSSARPEHGACGAVPLWEKTISSLHLDGIWATPALPAAPYSVHKKSFILWA